MRRVTATILFFAFFLAFATPTFASSGFAAENEGDVMGVPEVANEIAEELSDAYIYLSEQLAEDGIATSICYEDFATQYINGDYASLEAYTEDLIQVERENRETGMNNIEATDPSEIVIFSANQNVETHTDESTELLDEYNDLLFYFEAHGYNIYLPYDIFVEAYSQGEYDDVYEFIESRIVSSDVSTYTNALAVKWYDNIGTVEKPNMLPHTADYSRYNIRDVVVKGDIIYEDAGGITEITGHIAIVQGKFYDVSCSMYYIRTIEANLDGVVYGVLDDDRCDEKSSKVYKVTTATATQINDAVQFCKDQIGDAYNLGVIISPSGYCNTLTSVNAWYCSELVWAGYYNAGINLDATSRPTNIYYPVMLASSNKLTRRTIS